MHTDIAAITEITGQHYQDPADFKCVEKSPVGDAVLSPYDMNYPSVDMRHIFCGQIVHNEAQGFHSLNPSTDWKECVMKFQCKFFSDQNAYCKEVYIRTHDGYELKTSGSNTCPACSTVPVFIFQLSASNNQC